MSFSLGRNATKVILSRAGALTDITEEMRGNWSSAGYNLGAFLANTDFIYLGQKHQFNNKYISFETVNSTPAKMKIEYRRTDTWEQFRRQYDQTDGFNKDGWISWEERLEWIKRDTRLISELSTLPGRDDDYWDQMYWIRISFDADLAAMTIRNIKTMFADGSYFPSIFPEINEYLPTGQADFMPQLELAKDFIVKELMQKNLISYEDQIKNIDDWALHCSYRAIVLILAPISGDERLIKVKVDMDRMAKETYVGAAASIDTNKNEVLDPIEREPGGMDWLTR
jgi:hypothetical protein